MAEARELRLDPGLAVRWDEAAVRAGAEGPAWELDGSLGPGRALRVLSASFEDGALLLVAAARPAGAAGHDAEHVAGLLVGPDGDGRPFDEVLLSTQYDPGGAVRRIGLELYPPGEEYPMRAAGDAAEAGGKARARLRMRLDGRAGTGLLEIRSHG